VGVAGRHAHVDDRDVGKVRSGFQQQVVGVARPADDGVAGLGEKRGDAFAKKSIVVGDDDAQRLGRVHRALTDVAWMVAMTDMERPGGQLADSRDLRQVEHAVARILAETDRPVEVYAGVLEAIGGSLGWQGGAVWELGPHDQRLRCVQTWHVGEGLQEFEALSERLALGPGAALPGRGLAAGEPPWIVDAPDDPNFPRAHAARRAGLHAAFGFPLRSPAGVVGVMEFFSRDALELDTQLLRTMDALGSEVGQFVTRRHAEERVRANESRLRAMLEAALDAVVTMDHRGRILGWNHAAETTFGYSAD